MGRISTLFFGFALGCGAIYCAFNYHVVKSDSGFQFVPKKSASLSETYVDIRKFGVSDWAAHPGLSTDIIASEQKQLMGGSATNTVENGARELLNNIQSR
jgi:hypothetical protein